MAFPIIPSGMFSGQGSTTRPNAAANGSVTSGISNGKITNLPYAYDSDTINTFAEIYNSGITNGTVAQTQEVLYTHSPATGLLASSFLYLVINLRATAYLNPTLGPWPDVSFLATLSGNYSDATPIQSPSNPYTVLSATAAQILAQTSRGIGYSMSFNGNIQIPFDQFAPKTIDIYSLSLSLKWVFGSNGSLAGSVGATIDARIYDISYVYL